MKRLMNYFLKGLLVFTPPAPECRYLGPLSGTQNSNPKLLALPVAYLAQGFTLGCLLNAIRCTLYANRYTLYAIHYPLYAPLSCYSHLIP